MARIKYVILENDEININSIRELVSFVYGKLDGKDAIIIGRFGTNKAALRKLLAGKK
jgi:hypothetical protein